MMGKWLRGAERVRQGMDAAGRVLTDEQALDAASIFASWDDGTTYIVGDRCRYGGLLYRCLTGHTAQSNWAPGAAPSLWVRIDDPGIEWPEWRQPQGSHDAYTKGAKVTHNGQRWISDIDGNIWAPGAYGWTKVA